MGETHMTSLPTRLTAERVAEIALRTDDASALLALANGNERAIYMAYEDRRALLAHVAALEGELATERKLSTDAQAYAEDREQHTIKVARGGEMLLARIASLEADLAACRRDISNAVEQFDDDANYMDLLADLKAALSAQAKAALPPRDSAGTGATAHKRAERCPHGVSELNRCERCD